MKLKKKFAQRGGTFNRVSFDNMLKYMMLKQEHIDELRVKYYTSSMTEKLINELKDLEDNKDLIKHCINIFAKYFILVDSPKTITCDKSTLSKITGLSERTIDERRRSGELPYIQLSDNYSRQGGRKVILFDPIEVEEYLRCMS